MLKTQHQLPPGPSGYQVFQLSQKFQYQPLEYLNSIWRKYGDLVRLQAMPGLTLYIAAHPNHAEHILSTHQKLYSKPDVFKKPMSLVVGQGIFTTEGEFWLQHRRLMQPAFHQKQIAKLSSTMVNSTESLLQEWAEKPDETVIDIAAEMMRLTLKIVSFTLFSLDISGESLMNLCAFILPV